MKSLWRPVTVIAALILVSCGGGGGGGDDDGGGTKDPVRIEINQTAVTLEAGGTYQFYYSVFNASDTSATWKVNDVTGGNATVGTISASGLYTAPAAVPDPNQVTVRVVANADTSKSATATVTINPPATLTISPTSVTVGAGATQQFTSNSGASWTVIGPAGTDVSTWGTINASGLYKAPSLPPWTGLVTVKATSNYDASKTATAAVTVVFSNATLKGRYVFRYRTAAIPTSGFTGRLWAVGSFEADGSGGITNGSADFSSFASTGNGTLNANFTGSYAVGDDGRATAEFNLQIAGNPALPMRWVLNSDAQARIAAFDDTGSGWGNIDRQDTSSFGTGLDGTFVFMYDGLVSPSRPLSAAGMFDVSGGTIGSGLIDINDNGTLTAGAAFAGTCSGIDPATGRGTWSSTVNGLDHSYVFYALNAAAFVFGSRMTDQGYLGVAVRQDKSSPFSVGSFAGDVAFISTGYVPVNQLEGIPAGSAGRFTADGQGNLSSGVADSIAGGTGTINGPASGTYTMSSNGHGTMSLIVNGGTNTLSVYMSAPNQGYYVSLMPSVSSTGQFLPQSLSGVNAAGLRSAFALTLRETFVGAGHDAVGRMILDGVNALTGIVDVNYAGILAPASPLSGTYSVTSNGRGEFSLVSGQASTWYAFYAVNRRLLFLVPISGGAPVAVGFAYRQY